MTTYCKLTDADGNTYGGTHWDVGVEHTAPGDGELCSADWLHAYADPVLAVLMNPIGASFDPETMRMFRFESDEIPKAEEGKLGFRHIRCEEWIDVPKVSIEQTIRFGILATKEVCKEPGWNQWADGWLDGSDRTAEAAEAEARAERATWAAASWAARAAWATRVEEATCAEEAARASWAAEAAWAARAVTSQLDLVAIAHKAMETTA